MKQRYPIRLLLLTLLFTASVFITEAQKPLYLVFLNTDPDREILPEEEVAELRKGHLANIGRLYEEGQLILAGPFEGGGGVFVLTASSGKEAKAHLSTDPAIRAQRFKIELSPMKILSGMICEQDGPCEKIT